MNIGLCTLVLLVQFIGFILYIPHVTLSTELSSQQKSLYVYLGWMSIYLPPVIGSVIIYLGKRRWFDALTFLLAVIVLDSLALVIPAAFHWLYWLYR